MPRFGWMGTLREPSRRATFSFLKQALSTDDGRAILAESLTGQLASPSQIDVNAEVLSEAPYLELGTPSVRRQLAAPPVFITARFRSGSTLLWNIFRNVERCTAYYEPLNERRWFDPAARGNRVDATHVGVSDYWREYEGLSNLATLYQAHWIERHLFMGPQFWDPNLFKYIRTLIDAAPHQAVLQFNRVDFRLPWLRRTFPEARVVHLYRHPRDQWCSSLVDVTSFSPAGTVAEFEPHDHFYLLPWARDLRFHFPFVYSDLGEHPYRMFYFIWKLSYLFGRQYAHTSFCFEDLVDRPDVELVRLMGAASVADYSLTALKAVVAPQRTGKWKKYADDAWFKHHEAHCETVLQEYFSSGRDDYATRDVSPAFALPRPSADETARRQADLTGANG
jgi:hypothetical protein